MHILEWHIDRFGGLANLTVTPESGFNLILGKNEVGKSTIMAFIKAMFYGLTGKAHNLLDNDRKRLMPWGESTMSGWLVFMHGGKTYRIERTFGLASRFDRRVLRDETTGQAIDLPARLEIGDDLFHVSEQEFINTVFIGQLATADVSPDGGTLAKLTNLATTGDESISSDEIDTRIRKAMVRLKAEKGNGGLINSASARRNELLAERQAVLQNELARSEAFHHLKEAEQVRAQARDSLADLRQILDSTRDWIIVQRSDFVAGQVRELQDLENQVEQVSQALTQDGRIIDAAFLSDLRSQQSEWTGRQAQLAEMVRNRASLSAQLAQLNQDKEAYQSIAAMDQSLLLEQAEVLHQLDEDRLTIRKMAIDLREVQSEQTEQQQIVRQAREKAVMSEESLDAFRSQMAFEYQQAAEDVTARETAYEAQQQELARYKESVKTDRKIKRSVVISTLAGVILAFVSLIAGLQVDPLAFALIPLGLLVSLVFGLRAWRVSQTRRGLQTVERAALTRLLLASGDALAESRMRQKTLQVRLEQRETQLLAQQSASRRALQLAEAGFSGQAERWDLALDNLSQSPVWLRYPNIHRDQLNPSASTADQLEEALGQLAASVQQQYDRSSQAMAEVLQLTDCATLDEMKQQFTKSQELKRHVDQLTQSLAKAALDIEAVMASQIASSQRLVQSLGCFFPERINVPADLQIEELARRRANLDSLQITLAERQTALLAQTGGRLPGQLANDADEARTRLSKYYPNAPDDLLSAQRRVLENEGLETVQAGLLFLAVQIEDAQKRLHELDNACIRLESDLKNRFSENRNLEEIDADIQQCESSLKSMHAEYGALGLARKAFSEAFQQLQQNFGPQLNQRSGEILAELTGGRYQSMRVDRSFAIHVAEPGSGVLREWSYLSGGTVDQVYLALRLAVAELVANCESKLPICLDDVFVQYDDQRALAGLEFLGRYAKEQNHQVLLFSCHERLNSLSDVKPIRIESNEV